MTPINRVRSCRRSWADVFAWKPSSATASRTASLDAALGPLLTKHERDELTGPAGTARHVAHRGRSRSYRRALSAESVGLIATEARLLSSRRSVDVTA